MSEKPFPEVLREELNYLRGEGLAMHTVFCSVRIGKLHPELAQAIKYGFSEAKELMTSEASSRYNEAPECVTHALRAIEEMRAAALDGV
jgi:hypothetical protein